MSNKPSDLRYLQQNPNFRASVAQEIERLGLPQDAYSSPSVPPPTLEEKEKLDATSFPAELQFTVPVNLSDSRTAFKNFLLGLNNSSDFVGLWSFKPCDPRNYQNPIGDIEVKLFAQPNNQLKAL